MVFSTYLTKKENPQIGLQRVMPNIGSLVDPWYNGIDEGVIFEDQLHGDFKKLYSKVKFVNITDYEFSANDERFRLFRDYLLYDQDIKTAWFTDLFDVKINSVPKINEDDDRLFVSNEEETWGTNKWALHMYAKCPIDSEYLLGKVIYNPGVWGGSRKVVMRVLNDIVNLMEAMRVGEKNVNMMVFNYVVHSFPQDKIVTGYPLHSKFKGYELKSKAHFIHK